MTTVSYLCRFVFTNKEIKYRTFFINFYSMFYFLFYFLNQEVVKTRYK